MEIGYACLEAERALQAVDCCLDDLMGAAGESGTQAQATRQFMTGRREALTAMDDLRLAIAWKSLAPGVHNGAAVPSRAGHPGAGCRSDCWSASRG